MPPRIVRLRKHDLALGPGSDPSLLKIGLYERGVESSYKYVTFYANFAWAILLVPIARLELRSTDALLLPVAALLLCASYVLWTYFVNYLDKRFL